MGFRILKNSIPIRRILISGNNYRSRLSPVTAVLCPDSFPYFEDPSSWISRRWHIGHSHHHHDHREEFSSGAEGERIFRLGLGADVGLAAGKALTGYLSGSTAIIADAAHSISDVVLSGVALLSYKAARIPKDKEHPYGHGKFETLGALGISGMLLITAGGIGWHAVDVLLGALSAGPDLINNSLAHEHAHGHDIGGHHHGIDMAHPVLALSMTTLSIAVKEGLYWITRRAGERAGSGLMKANAWHHRSDAVSSVVALIGVGGSILGMRFLDPLAGLVVSGMILKVGLESGYQSILELVDAAVPSQLMEPYKHTILQVEGVKGCNHLRGRRAGSFLYLDINIEVDPFSSVSAAHDIGENVRRNIQNFHPEIAEVFIHIDPAISEISPVPRATEVENSDQKGNGDTSLDGLDVEEMVRNTLSSKFSEKLTVQHITRHQLQGHILLQIEVSMHPDLLIRDAFKVAEEAKKHILEVVPDIVSISMQLQLGDATPPLHHESGGSQDKLP